MNHCYDFDLFVIGAGSGGVRLARMSAAMGAKVAVAEDRYLGGTCVNVGCVPKKLFVYASHVAEELEDGSGYGWHHSGQLSFDWPTLIANKNTEIQRLNGIYQSLLVNAGVAVINGRARFVDAHTVDVNGQRFTAERIVIASGSWPFVPEFPGKELTITSNELFFLKNLPKKAIVVGGGYIAVEMAGILNGLGVETSLLYRGEMILRGFDEEIRAFVKEEMHKKGLRFLFQDNIARIETDGKNAAEPLTVVYESGKQESTGLVLFATGRVPHTQDLGLENVDVTLNDKGEIIVDAHFQTSEPSIYALGDVTGGMQLTPVALAEGMYLARYLFAVEKPKPLSYELIPTAVFCQPNIATVGLTEEQARAQFNEVSVFVSNFKPMKHTLSGRDERCLMKLVVDKQSDKVLGAHMVGSEAGEIVQGLAVAMKAGATKAIFDETIGIHPTAAEEFVTMRQARN
jgi:glutathione reductase (NADPH)